jgi:hypothetical protein
MVSVIVTTKDQAHQVESSIGSIIAQDFDEDFDILAVDDGSTDNTVGEIERLFGERVKIIRKGRPDGWLKSLSSACNESSGELIAVCDPHCVVKSNWLKTISQSFRSDSELSIMTGPAIHGDHFMEKLAALTFHSQFSSQRRENVPYIFDDNFAIRKDVLTHLLLNLPVEKNLNDGVGCALLSSQAKQQGISVLYEPQMAAFHVSPDFKGYLYEWKVITAENTIDIRLLDPSIRGAGILKHLSLAPVIYPTVRVLLDVGNAWRLKKDLGLSYLQLPFLLMADLIGKIWYGIGLSKVVKERKKTR